MVQSLQDRYAPNNACFGCGPANERGLRIKSYAADGETVADWCPEPHHQAFGGIVNGGIIGTLLDCHGNWTAAHALMIARGLDAPPCTVTTEFHIKLRAPTPLDATLHLSAQPVRIEGDRVVVEASLEASGKVTATCRGVFVAVQQGHPAFHRW
jgi:acyl-coenzyme A thioesterase PaaI-like protein